MDKVKPHADDDAEQGDHINGSHMTDQGSKGQALNTGRVRKQNPLER